MLEAVFEFKTLNWNDVFFEIDMIENQIKLRWRDFAYIHFKYFKSFPEMLLAFRPRKHCLFIVTTLKS